MEASSKFVNTTCHGESAADDNSAVVSKKDHGFHVYMRLIS